MSLACVVGRRAAVVALALCTLGLVGLGLLRESSSVTVQQIQEAAESECSALVRALQGSKLRAELGDLLTSVEGVGYCTTLRLALRRVGNLSAGANASAAGECRNVTEEEQQLTKQISEAQRKINDIEIVVPGMMRVVQAIKNYPSPTFSFNDHHGHDARLRTLGFSTFSSSTAANKKPTIALVTTCDLAYMLSWRYYWSAVSCYAAHHGYSAYWEPVQLSTDRHQVLARYRAVQKYLPYFDYIVHISSDVLPVNRSKSIEDIILQSPDKDVIFNFRYTCHKIERSHCAYHYSTELIIIKNSPRGREFVERMLAGSDGNPPDMWLDMGMLHDVAMKMSGLSNDSGCMKFYDEYVQKKRPWSQLVLYDYFDACREPLLSFANSSSWFRVLKIGEMCRDIGFSGVGSIDNVGRLVPRELLHDEGALLLRYHDFFLHAKGAMQFWLTTEDVYCLPVQNGTALPDKAWSNEQQSVEFAAKLGLR